MTDHQFSAIIERDETWYVALCPELDIASQGRSEEKARTNLTEAIEVFLEAASPNEIESRLRARASIRRNPLGSPPIDLTSPKSNQKRPSKP